MVAICDQTSRATMPSRGDIDVSGHQNSKTDRATILESSSVGDGKRHPRLIVVSGLMLGHQIELGSEAVLIGRASECAICLPHPSVSRQHCRIWCEGGRYHIEDLGSTNRTYLNGEAIT